MHVYCTELLLVVLTWNSEDVYEGKEYAVSFFLTTWENADAVCSSNNASLASASTASQDSFLRQRFVDASTT